jgi:signal transduction histidine kinase
MEDSPPTADKLARLAQLESEFQRALEMEKLEALAEFAAGAGHEINNPLTVISGRAQLLLRDEADPERRHALALISTQAMRVHEMIADMMLFARPPRPELQRVELVELIDAVLASLSARAAAQETTIGRGGDNGPIFLEADPVQLQVALRAICQNSLDALQSGGHVEIILETKASRLATDSAAVECLAAAGTAAPVGAAVVLPPLAGDRGMAVQLPSQRVDAGTAARDETEADMSPVAKIEVRIHVRDDGPGLKPEERRHVFDPFFSARQAGRGLGLGLSKAWRIVANHGGRIEVDSQPGRGATFTIVLNQDRTQ